MVAMEKIVSLCKRRGFIYPGSEIYGGLANTWDYGPLGVELKNNIKKVWWQDSVWKRPDMVGLDAAILMNPKVWQASGHIEGFTDPLVECKSCHKRFRADQLVEEFKDSAKLDEHGIFTPEELADLTKAIKKIKCPDCGGELTEPKQFNLLMETHLGPVEDAQSKVYLRGETAQGIFVDFNLVRESSRMKIPFGIAQIGKSFRNEITPGNFTFRTREFEQMEIEYFVKPGTDKKWYQYWRKERFNWYIKYGIAKKNLRLRDHKKDELAHYAVACADVEYQFPFGWSELEGIANRKDYDLKQHAKHSGQDLRYFDEETKEKYLPYVIEPSGGVDRTALAFLVDAYEEIKGGRTTTTESQKEVEVVLRLDKELAPIKVAVLPLVRNKKDLVKKAQEVYDLLKGHWLSQYDEVGSIGRRYRRQDEVGTPFCLTIDFETLKQNDVTVRDRDTMKQKRVKIGELIDYTWQKSYNAQKNHS